VVSERRELGCPSRTLEPAWLVLTRRRIGRPDECRDRKPCRPPAEKPLERPPNLVVKRLFDMTGDDGVAVQTRH
jgi:hypothetical protein